MDLKESNISGEFSGRHPWELARSEVVLSLIKKYYDFSSENECIIYDIGCGDIFLAERLSKKIKASKIIAIDNAFNSEIISQLEKKINNPAISIFQSIQQAKTLNKPADIILLLDVLEHIKDDKGFLSSLLTESFVNHKTLFVITVPAFQTMFSSHDEFLNHFRRYSNKTLLNTINKAGLSAVDYGYFFYSLFLIRCFQSYKTKIFGHPNKTFKGVARWKERKFLDYCLKNFLIIDFRLFKLLKNAGLKFPGLSNYIICKKSV